MSPLLKSHPWLPVASGKLHSPLSDPCPLLTPEFTKSFSFREGGLLAKAMSWQPREHSSPSLSLFSTVEMSKIVKFLFSQPLLQFEAAR